MTTYASTLERSIDGARPVGLRRRPAVSAPSGAAPSRWRSRPLPPDLAAVDAAGTAEESAASDQILGELRRQPNRLCPDAILLTIGWGAVKPPLGHYRRLMHQISELVAASGEGRLERVWETGWILHPSCASGPWGS